MPQSDKSVADIKEEDGGRGMHRFGWIGLILIMGILGGCDDGERRMALPEEMQIPEVQTQIDVDETAAPVIIEHRIHRADIVVVGDIMFHEYQLTRSYDAQTDSFDFQDQFTDIKPYISEADYAIGNLETTLAGKRGRANNIGGYTGYPCFNTPDIGAQHIKEAGFDFVTTANNHSMDSGPDGVIRTLEVLDRLNIEHTGSARSRQEQQEIKIVDANGIRLAVISCTYDLNGFFLPEEKPYLVNTLMGYDAGRQKAICDLVAKADGMNPDFVVVLPHFGLEYQEEPSTAQKAFVEQLFQAGADLILGSHPHVLQPIEVRTLTRKNGEQEQGVLIYSLGNFISSQKAEKGMNKDLGVIMGLELEKVDDQKAVVSAITLVPTYTYWSDDTIGVLPVDEALEKSRTGIIKMNAYDRSRLNFAQSYSINHLMSHMPDMALTYEDYRHRIELN